MNRPGMICPVCGRYLRNIRAEVLMHAAWHLVRELWTGALTRFFWSSRGSRPVMFIFLMFLLAEITFVLVAVYGDLK